MTLKTPEQVATERIEFNYGTMLDLDMALNYGDVYADGVHAMIAAAVEDDRQGRGDIIEGSAVTEVHAEVLAADTTTSGGVWAHIIRDHYESITSVYATEIEALREAVRSGHGRVAFIPYGDLNWQE